MRIEVEIAQLVSKGASFEDIMESARKQLLPEYDRTAQVALRDAKVRVTDGTYTADDLVTLQRHLNDVKREKVEKENVKAAPKVSYPHDEIIKALGMANVVHKGQWR